MPESIIQAENLTKRYGSFTAVGGISFHVDPGECVGFLGPNGAGKTTTIAMVCCLTPVTDGTVRVFGMDVMKKPRAIKSQLGISPQEDNLDPEFSVRENLILYARYFGLSGTTVEKRTDQLLDFFQLTEKKDAKMSELSGGMKRRLVLARALINSPKLLVLDEPTTGLDPQVRHLIWQRIRQLKNDGITVLITSHYMEEATQLCDRVILMDSAKILLEGTPASLIAQEVGQQVVELWNYGPDLRSFIASKGWPLEEVEDRFYLYDRSGGEIARAISERFSGQDRLIRQATLEDVFLKKAGRKLRE
ncbi:MAG: ATP-binding cassette domain-containing protein [Pseudomonadota bacterium]